MMTQEVRVDFRAPMPIFPLADFVLLPQNILPLHVFEPRYREMVSRALDRDGLIAMARFDGHIDLDDYLYGRPPLRPVLCLGTVCEYEQLDDGRFLLLLQGVCRCQAVREIQNEPYRTFLLEPFHHRGESGAALDVVRQRILDIVNDHLFDGSEAMERCRTFSELAPSTSDLIDLVAFNLLPEGEDRYHILAEPDPVSRAVWLIHRLSIIGNERRRGGLN
jgi:Lon protease-like protein